MVEGRPQIKEVSFPFQKVILVLNKEVGNHRTPF